MFFRRAFLGAVAALTVTCGHARADEGCKPVETLSESPAALVGRKAWIWNDDERQLRSGPKGVGMSITYKQIGPQLWALAEDLLPYGEPVEIVSFEPERNSTGRMTVRTADGRQAIVPGGSVKLYEFWKCTVQQLLEVRRVPTDDGRYPFVEDKRWARTVWVRLTDKTTPVESFRAWMKPEEVAKIDLLLCRQVWGPRQQPPAGTYDLNGCTALFPSGWGQRISLDPKAVEVVSPTSMRILTGS
jgi:hypothetical protein